jgi:hypothetical protein
MGLETEEFAGFSLPEGTFLPPEFSELLPELRTLGEVKVLLVILAEYLRAGLDARALTHNEIQALSGLARGTVNAALLSLRTRLGCVRRIGAPGGGYRYEPALKESLGSLRFRPPMHDSLHVFRHEQASQALLDDMHDSVQLLNEKCGVSLRVAEDIARRYSASDVKRHCSYALAASRGGLIKKTLAAYVVASLRDNWGPPLGWEEGEEKGKRWFSDDEFETFFVQPEEKPEEGVGDE